MKTSVSYSALIAPLLIVLSPQSVDADDKSGFFLQDHGEVRVHRGVDAGTNVEPAPSPEEGDVDPSTATATQVEPRPSGPEAGPRTTREAAIQRARERGIPTDEAATRKKRSSKSGQTRREAIARSREKGIPTHRASDSSWKPYNARGKP